MKDAKGHGSNPRGAKSAHSTGVGLVGRTPLVPPVVMTAPYIPSPQFTAEQPKAFRDWFGDSKVVDPAGRPLVVYHGSPDARGLLQDGFKTPMERYKGTQSDDEGFFASSDSRVAGSYADPHRAFDLQNSEPAVVPLYLSVKNPMMVDARGQPWRGTADFVQKAKASGHDGLIIKNSMDYYNNESMGGLKNQKPTSVYVWFNASQAKPASHNPILSRTDRKPLPGKWYEGQ